jgi:bifunctional DNA-binding transcriptional regulator/antitoxin component of YhaV-PrlF toxin-antitoxin module
MKEVFKARLNNEGRIVIPFACRKQLGLTAGQEVMVSITEQGLLISTFEQALKRFQDEVTRLVGPGVSLADELIAERRVEAAKEAGE